MWRTEKATLEWATSMFQALVVFALLMFGTSMPLKLGLFRERD
jgi:hypothetical protein